MFSEPFLLWRKGNHPRYVAVANRCGFKGKRVDVAVQRFRNRGIGRIDPSLPFLMWAPVCSLCFSLGTPFIATFLFIFGLPIAYLTIHGTDLRRLELFTARLRVQRCVLCNCDCSELIPGHSGLINCPECGVHTAFPTRATRQRMLRTGEPT